MAEIPAITAARAFALQTEARNLRDQQVRNNERLDLLRQTEIDRRQRDVEEQLRVRQRRLQTLRDAIRNDDAARKLFRAQRLAQDNTIRDHAFFLLQTEIKEEILRARDLEPQPPVAAPTAAEPVVGLAALDDLEATPGLDVTQQVAFELQEKARSERLTERLAADLDSQIQQRIDLRLAGDRIEAAQGNFDSNLPRGSIVDVFG